jgi:hypothetical protein
MSSFWAQLLDKQAIDLFPTKQSGNQQAQQHAWLS